MATDTEEEGGKRLEDGEIDNSSGKKGGSKRGRRRTSASRANKNDDKTDNHARRRDKSKERTSRSGSLPRYDVRHLLERRRASRRSPPRHDSSRKDERREQRRRRSTSPRRETRRRRSRSRHESDHERHRKRRSRSRDRDETRREGVSSSRVTQKEVYASGDKIMVSVSFDQQREEERRRHRHRRRNASSDDETRPRRRSKKRSKKKEDEYGERERCKLDNGRTTTKEAMQILQQNKPAAVIDLMGSPQCIESEKEIVDLDDGNDLEPENNVVRRGPCTPPPVNEEEESEVEEEHIQLDVTPKTPPPPSANEMEGSKISKTTNSEEVAVGLKTASPSSSPRGGASTAESELRVEKGRSAEAEQDNISGSNSHSEDMDRRNVENQSQNASATTVPSASSEINDDGVGGHEDDTYDPCVPTDSPPQDSPVNDLPNGVKHERQPEEEEESFEQFFDKLLATNNAAKNRASSSSSAQFTRSDESEAWSVEKSKDTNDNSVPMDLESPYCSPQGSDLSDIFEPPDNENTRRKSSSKKSKSVNGSRRTMRSNGVKSKVRVKGDGRRVDGQSLRIVDEVPTSAVEMAVKEKFLVKVQRQERTVEEIKMLLKPLYSKRKISKQSYKEIMKKCVPKVCHSKGGEINTSKIQKLVEGYVKKYQHLERKQKRLQGHAGT